MRDLQLEVLPEELDSGILRPEKKKNPSGLAGIEPMNLRITSRPPRRTIDDDDDDDGGGGGDGDDNNVTPKDYYYYK